MMEFPHARNDPGTTINGQVLEYFNIVLTTNKIDEMESNDDTPQCPVNIELNTRGNSIWICF